MQRYAKFLIVFVVALATLGWMLLDRTHITADDMPDTAAQTGPQASDVTFALLNGEKLPLRSLAGHTVWLHFWTSWCAPCRTEFPALLKRLKASDSNTVLLAVSGDARAEDAERFLAPLRRDFAALFASGRIIVARDADRKLIEGTFQTFQYPETIVIAPNLAMQRKIAGAWQDKN